MKVDWRHLFAWALYGVALVALYVTVDTWLVRRETRSDRCCPNPSAAAVSCRPERRPPGPGLAAELRAAWRSAHGAWRPGISDPTPAGWLTTFLYLASAALCGACAVRHGADGQAGPPRLWWTFAVVLLVLGINKQLDVQTLITQVGRGMAQAGAWHGDRRLGQSRLLSLLGVAGLGWLGILAYVSRPAWSRCWPALTGAVLLIVFVLVRAAPFHAVKAVFGESPRGLCFRGMLEVGGISLIGMTALRHLLPLRRRRAL